MSLATRVAESLVVQHNVDIPDTFLHLMTRRFNWETLVPLYRLFAPRSDTGEHDHETNDKLDANARHHQQRPVTDANPNPHLYPRPRCPVPEAVIRWCHLPTSMWQAVHPYHHLHPDTIDTSPTASHANGNTTVTPFDSMRDLVNILTACRVAPQPLRVQWLDSMGASAATPTRSHDQSVTMATQQRTHVLTVLEAALHVLPSCDTVATDVVMTHVVPTLVSMASGLTITPSPHASGEGQDDACMHVLPNCFDVDDNPPPCDATQQPHEPLANKDTQAPHSHNVAAHPLPNDHPNPTSPSIPTSTPTPTPSPSHPDPSPSILTSTPTLQLPLELNTMVWILVALLRRTDTATAVRVIPHCAAAVQHVATTAPPSHLAVLWRQMCSVTRFAADVTPASPCSHQLMVVCFDLLQQCLVSSVMVETTVSAASDRLTFLEHIVYGVAVLPASPERTAMRRLIETHAMQAL
eukprot:m.98347 g.98347  ORF g.98347 m.98347 type:complete len:466 (-) comp10253_c1_seq4:1459-2856(-)